MPAGRPSTLPESVEPAWEYVNGGYLEHDEVYPSVAGLAVFLGKRRETIHVWAKENEEFSNIVESLLAKQEKILANSGLKGDTNASITKLLLTKHGYSDKVENALTGADGGPVQIQEIKRVVVDPSN
jgi:hypothetical protein